MVKGFDSCLDSSWWLSFSAIVDPFNKLAGWWCGCTDFLLSRWTAWETGNAGDIWGKAVVDIWEVWSSQSLKRSKRNPHELNTLKICWLVLNGSSRWSSCLYTLESTLPTIASHQLQKLTSCPKKPKGNRGLWERAAMLHNKVPAWTSSRSALGVDGNVAGDSTTCVLNGHGIWLL